MESHCDSIMGKLLILIVGIFLAVTLLGCHDPIVADMEAEHRKLGDIAKQELRQGLLFFRRLHSLKCSIQCHRFDVLC